MLRTLLLLGCLSAGGAVAAWPAAAPRPAESEGVARAPEESPSSEVVLCGLPSARDVARLAPGARSADPVVRDAAPALDAPAVTTDAECDADMEFVEEPTDPVETGPCRLTLRFVRSGDEQPVRPRAVLWHLGAPGNLDWTWGDQSHGEGCWRDDALVFERLPVGRYRVQALGAARGSDDPAAFDVLDPDTHVRLVVPMPPTHKVFLVALDENGARLASGSRRWTGSLRHRTEDTPGWLRRRNLRAASEEECLGTVGWFGSTTCVSCCCGGGTPIEAGARGFEISEFSEPSRGEGAVHSVRLERPGRSSIRVRVDGDEAGESGDRTYLGLSVPLALLDSHVVLPDGGLATDAGAHLAAECDAVRLSTSMAHDAWRALPIHVRVTLDGYEPLTFDFTLDELPTRRTLQPRYAR